jgi:hypothetical protein
METVKACFIHEIKTDENATGNARGQSTDIYQTVDFIFQEITPGDFEITSDHTAGIYCRHYISRQIDASL